MGGPKVPRNYKDQEKIQAKIAEWEAEAENQRHEYPLATTVGQWCIRNKENKVAAEGTGAADLIDILIRFDSEITKIYGLEIRTRLKGAFIECIGGSGREVIPEWIWAPTDPPRLIDPVEMLLYGHKEKLPLDQLFEALSMGVTADWPLTQTPNIQSKFVFDFCRRLRIKLA